MAVVWVTGAAGMVGSWLVARAPSGHTAVGTTRVDVELSDAAAVHAAARRIAPDVVVHTAYGTAELDRDVVAATANVADACAAVGAALVYLSTDVVFDGTAGPYAEDAELTPLHAYGRAKAAAEVAVIERVPDAAIVRTSLVCWDDPIDPRSAAVIDGLRAGAEVRLFVDELRNPVRVDDLVEAIWAIVAMPRSAQAGAWHLVGDEACSRYELGVTLARWAGLDPAGITATRSADWSGPEPRPRDCRLTTGRAIAAGLRLRPARTLFP